jgi:hypothetical protein
MDIIYILTLPIIIYILLIILYVIIEKEYLKRNPIKIQMQCLAFDQLDQKVK